VNFKVDATQLEPTCTDNKLDSIIIMSDDIIIVSDGKSTACR